MVITGVTAFLCGLIIRLPGMPSGLSMLRALSATSTVQLTDTPHPTDVPALTPTPTYSVAYLAQNVIGHAGFTLYLQRALWETAVGGSFGNEDFEKELADFGALSLPYLTANEFVLEGESSVQILADPNLLPSGSFIHFRDPEGGLAFRFPGEFPVTAFGFDHRTTEPWQLEFIGSVIDIPSGRPGFVGILLHGSGTVRFRLFTIETTQTGLSVDNISFVPRRSP